MRQKFTTMLAHEKSFLQDGYISTVFTLETANKLFKDVATIEAKNFESSLKLAEYLCNGYERIFSDAGQELAKGYGVKWKKSNFVALFPEQQRSSVYRYLQLGNIPNNVVDEFRAKVKEAKEAGKNTSVSYPALIAYSKGTGQFFKAENKPANSDKGSKKFTITLVIDSKGSPELHCKGGEIDDVLHLINRVNAGADVTALMQKFIKKGDK